MLQDKSFSNINIDYYLIDELHPAKGQKDAVAEGILNCVTALIEVERSKNQKNLEEILHQLSIKLNTKEKLSRFRTFLRFLRRYVSAKFKKEIPNDFRNMEEAINITRCSHNDWHGVDARGQHNVVDLPTGGFGFR